MDFDVRMAEGYDDQVGYYYRAYLVLNGKWIPMNGYWPTKELAVEASLLWLDTWAETLREE